MKKQKISKEQARKIIINAQLLDGQAIQSEDKNGIINIIDKLGYIQIDTISIINRSHHHTLWSRFPKYQKEFLHKY